jgi:hypothetical protein
MCRKKLRLYKADNFFVLLNTPDKHSTLRSILKLRKVAGEENWVRVAQPHWGRGDRDGIEFE